MKRARLALLVALASCATSTVSLDARQLSTTPGLQQAARPQDRRSVPLWIARSENRLGTTSLGLVGGRFVRSEEVCDWVDRELSARLSRRWAVLEGSEPPGEARLALRPRVLKAYVWSVSTSMTAVVVLEVTIEKPGEAAVSKVYRGQDTGVNWASAASGMIGMLQGAMGACLDQIERDLQATLARTG